ncbi:MAG: hypothetical protein WA021_03810 [Minisyncoccia bacterium]
MKRARTKIVQPSDPRPWGKFYDLDIGKNWRVKTLYLKAGKRLSLQYHRNRSERWILVEGDATAITADRNGRLRAKKLVQGKMHVVGLRQVHRLFSKRGGIIVEVWIGNSSESDIVRLKDDFGRVK